MRTFVVRSLALIVVLGTGVAAGQEKDAPKRPKREINIGTAGFSDWMYIYDDGSGTVGYGAGGSYQVFFKAGTFDFEAVEKELRALKCLEKGDKKAHYGFGFVTEQKKGDKPPQGFTTAERKYISGLFQKGIESHIHKGIREDRNGRFLLGRVSAIRMADTWVVESAEYDGKPVAGLKGLKLTLSHPSDNTKVTELVDRKEQAATMRLAPDYYSTPYELELTAHVVEPRNVFNSKRVTIGGVYALNGDELRIRRNGSAATITGVVWDVAAEQPAGKQPMKLDAKEGVLLILKRVAK